LEVEAVGFILVGWVLLRNRIFSKLP